jgi:ribosomal protein L37AE/L43A
MTGKTEQEEVEKPKKEKIKCSKCRSLFGYLRIKDKIWVCRSCGFESEVNL